MAAPSIRQHVRIKLSFQGVTLEPAWLFIEFSKFKTIEDIHIVILSRYFPEQPCKLKLFLHDCVLPVRENCLILENNDAIIVDCQKIYKDKNAADHSNMKRKKRATRDSPQEEIASDEEATEFMVKQKKKKKRCKASADLSIEQEAMQMDDPFQLLDKNQSFQKSRMEDENVMLSEDSIHASIPAEDFSNKRSQNRDDHESKQLRKKHRLNETDSCSSLKVAPATENMDMILASCSTSGMSIKDSVEMTNASMGNDAEVSVDMIEHKAKRRHRKRKRKTKSPSTLSTTPTYRNPEQCVTKVHANIESQDKRKHQGGGRHVHFGSDDSVDESSEKDERTSAQAIPAASVCNDSAMLESNFAYCKQDINSEALSPDGAKEASQNGDNPTDAGDVNTSQPPYVEKYGVAISPHVNEDTYNNDILSSHNSNSGMYIMSSDSLSGPTVINELFSSKQSSPVVFTRPRQKKYRAFSKEEQLNTSSSNRSIIFQNPADDDRAMPIEVTAIPITVDYQRFPVLQGFPRAGDKIAYKDLVLNDNYEPVLSDFKEAVVVGFDAISKNVDLEIKRQTETPRKYGKFDVVLEDAAGSLTNIPNEAEKNNGGTSPRVPLS